MEKRARVTLGAQPSRVKPTRRCGPFQRCGGGGGGGGGGSGSWSGRWGGGESSDVQGRRMPEVAPPVARKTCASVHASIATSDDAVRCGRGEVGVKSLHSRDENVGGGRAGVGYGIRYVWQTVYVYLSVCVLHALACSLCTEY